MNTHMNTEDKTIHSAWDGDGGGGKRSDKKREPNSPKTHATHAENHAILTHSHIKKIPWEKSGRVTTNCFNSIKWLNGDLDAWTNMVFLNSTKR